MTGIAYQYALAVFSLAEESNQAEEFKATLAQFAEGMDEESYKFFNHPKIARADKMKLVESIHQNSLLVHFLKVLIENDRISLLDAIVMAYQEILDNLNKVMPVTVISKKTLTQKNIDKIKARLHQTYQRKIVIEQKIDETIIGGFRIEFEGNIIDETVNKQLENIKSSLLE